MPLAGREMILIVRTQDFASRNLSKISDNIGKLSRVQAISRRQNELDLRQARVANRLAQGNREMGQLRTLQDRLNLQRRLLTVERDRTALQSKMAGIRQAAPLQRGAGGRFLPIEGYAALKAESAALGAEQVRLGRSIRATELWINRMPPAMQGMAASEARLTERTTTLQARLETLRREMELVGRNQSFNKQALRIASTFGRIHDIGGTISRIGRSGQLAGGIGTFALGAAAKGAADFNTQLTRAATQAANIESKGFTDVTAKANQFGKIVRDSMGKFPATSQEMADSLYEIFSTFELGTNKVEKGRKLFDLFNKASVGGFTNLKTSTDLMITTLNNFDGAMQNPAKTLNTLFSIIRFGRVDMERLNSMMVQVAPAAKQANQSLEDISGALEVLTIRVGKAPQAATQFARLLQVFNDPDFQAGLERAGVKITDINGQLLPMNVVLHKIAERFPELEHGIANNTFFQLMTAAGRGSGRGRQFFIQAQRGFTNLITSLDLLDQKQLETIRNTGETERSVAAGFQSQGVRWAILTNKIRRSILEVGDAVFPVFERIGNVIGKVTDAFNRMDPATRRLIGTVAGFTVVGALIGGISMSIIGGLTSLVGTLGILTGKFNKAEGAAGRMNTMLSGLMRFAGIAISLSIILNLIKKGDASGWDFLEGAIAGGLAGFLAGGVPGAVVGAITVPVILKMQKDRFDFFGNNDPGLMNIERNTGFVNSMMAMARSFTPKVREEFQTGLVRAVGESGKIGGEEFVREFLNKIRFMPTDEIQKSLGIVNVVEKAIGQRRNFALTKNQQRINQAAAAENNARQSDLKAWNAWYRKVNAIRNDSAKYQKQLAGEVQRAEEQALQSIDQAAQNLTNTFMQFRQANQTAMGELFQGPFLTSEAFDLAKQWGVKASMGDLQKDLDMSLARFKKWRGDLAALAQRGAPPELLKQLQALGPEAMDNLETLRKADPAAWRKYVNSFKLNQEEIDKATKIDFSKQLAQWQSYGKKITQQIIMGVRSGDNIGMQNAMHDFIMNSFPNIVAEAKAKAAKDFKASHVVPPPEPRTPRVPNPKTAGSNVIHNTDTMNITIVGEAVESVTDTVRRAAFVFKNAKRDAKPPKKNKPKVDCRPFGYYGGYPR